MSSDPTKPEKDSWLAELAYRKTFTFVLLAPPLTGAFLIIEGLAGWGWVAVVAGAMLLIASPFTVCWALRGGLH